MKIALSIAIALLSIAAHAQTVTPPIFMQGAVSSNIGQLTVYSTPSTSAVIVDDVMTMQNVQSYADAGAARFVARHFGSSLGFVDSTASADIRASEHQVLRGLGTTGNTWGMEVGVHSQVAGDTMYKNLGIYLASSHAGWLSSGVRNDTGILIGGEDGWYHSILALDTDASTLFDVDKVGQMYSRKAVIGKKGVGNSVLRVETNSSGVYLRAEGFDFSGPRSMFLGTDYNVTAEITSSAVKPLVDAGAALGAPDKRFSTVYAGAATISGPVSSIPAASATPTAIGEMVFEHTNNTTIMVKLKGSDGVVRSGYIYLQ